MEPIVLICEQCGMVYTFDEDSDLPEFCTCEGQLDQVVTLTKRDVLEKESLITSESLKSNTLIDRTNPLFGGGKS